MTLLASAAGAMPLAARAQTSMPVIGFLDSGAPANMKPNLDGFHRGLAETGFVEGQNLAVEYRRAQSQYDRLPGLPTCRSSNRSSSSWSSISRPRKRSASRFR
jgi:putative ABC transport system substrate-binding protein